MRLADKSENESVLAEQVAKSQKYCFRVWTIIGVILLGIALGTVLDVLAIPVGIVLWATVIVFILRSPVNWLEKKGINRVLGTGIAYVGFFVIASIIALLMFSPAFGFGDQFMDLMESIPGYVNQFTSWYTDFTSQYEGIMQNDTVKTWVEDAAAALGSWASSIAQNSASGIVAIGSTVINSFMAIGFALVVAFWILMDLPAIGRECRRLISPKRQEDADVLYVTVTRVMGGYIKATLVQCVFIGLGCGIAFAIIGLPNAAALGGITGLLNIIPVVGPWLGGGLAALVGVFVSPWVGVIALVVTVAIQQVIYTFVSPKLMADSVDVHPALVIITLMAGSAIGGAMNGLLGSLVGMLASIPAVAAMKGFFVYYFEKNTGRNIVSEDGVFFKGSRTLLDKATLGKKDEPIDPSAVEVKSTDDRETLNVAEAAKPAEEEIVESAPKNTVSNAESVEKDNS